MRSLILTALLINLTVAAYGSEDGGLQSPFSLGTGARELALGGAGLAISSGPTSAYWNPAALVRAERYSLGGLHSSLFESGTSYQYLGAAIPTLDYGAFGFGVYRLGIDGIEKRDNSNMMLGEFADSRMAFYLAYGYSLSGFDLGLSLSLEHHSIDDYSSTSSPGIELAACRTIGISSSFVRKADIALVARNVVSPSFKIIRDDVSLPFAVDLGVSLELRPLSDLEHKATLSASLTKVEQLDAEFALGLEYGISDLVFLRGGIRDNHYSLGGGLAYQGVNFDYALVDRDLGSLHLFTVTTSFGRPVSERRKIRAERQEADFDRVMNQRLQAGNASAVSALVEEGRRAAESRDLTRADESLRRALFLASTSGQDTTAIASLLTEVNKDLTEIERILRYSDYVDSALTGLEEGDFVVARFYANRALVESPGSPEAQDLLEAATDSLNAGASHQQAVLARLSFADSLISYGRWQDAVMILDELVASEPQNELVDATWRRAHFERLRAQANSALGRTDLESAQLLVDSASAYFPDHQWCLDASRQISEATARRSVERVEVAPEPVRKLSEDLARQVESEYQQAQKAFKQGRLQQALQLWESVERVAPDYRAVRGYLVDAYRYVGVELYSGDKLDEAVAVWEKAMALDPDNKEIREYLERTRTEIERLREYSNEN